jgi:hypothetical protein
MAKDKKPLETIPGATPAENAIYSKKHMYIQLKHLPSDEEIRFKAMLTQFEDQYTSDWNMEQVFGRMDPIRSFRGTQRIITLGWDVVAASEEEAKHNLENCSTLLSMLYPSYDTGAVDPDSSQSADGSKDKQKSQNAVLESKENKAASSTGNAATIQGAPLFRLKFANLIQSAKTSQGSLKADDGLVGAIDGLTYSPDVEQGFFDVSPGVLYPQTIHLSFGFYVTHDHALGFSNQQWRATGMYPYQGENKK